MQPRQVLAAEISLGKGQSSTARVHNLSARGAALLTSRPFAPGAVLQVRLVNAAATFGLVVTARVVHCDRVLTGEHFMGCAFETALGPEELGPLLA
jgi:hypothetical protein